MLNCCICHNSIFLTEMTLTDLENWLTGNIVILKNLINNCRCQFLMRLIRNILNSIANLLAHIFRKTQTKVSAQYIAYAALSRLTVNTNNIWIISTSYILRVNWKIRNIPLFTLSSFSPCHALCDCILMRTRKCSKYKLSCIWLTLMNSHACHSLIYLY